MKKYLIILIVFIIGNHNFKASSFARMQTNSAVLQTDQKIVIAGAASDVDGTVSQFLVARYTVDGLLDNSFGTAGVITTAIGTLAHAQAIVVQTDGKIVAGGFSLNAGNNQITIVRYSSAGVLDPSFGTNGVVITPVAGGSSVNAIAVQADGKIVIAGTVITGNTTAMLVARYTSAGVLDASFANAGLAITAVGSRSNVSSIVLQADGKIVVGGFAEINGVIQFATARYTTQGLLDNTFGSGGTVTTIIGNRAEIQSIVIQADGKIIASGFSDTRVALARYSTSGVLDPTFGTAGVVTTAIGALAVAYESVIQSDGKIIVAGQSDNDSAIARYNATGILDTTFDTDGIVSFALARKDSAYAVLLQATGKIVVAGTADNASSLARFITTGALDTTFGTNGLLQAPAGTHVPTGTTTYIGEQQPTGTNGGTFTAGAWQTRVLNKIVGNLGNVSLLNNQFVLQPGHYQMEISSPAYKVDNHQIRLQNITDNKTEKYGSSAYAGSTQKAMITLSVLSYQIALSKPKTFAVQHYADTTQVNDGFGIAAGINGNVEIYTQVTLYTL